MDRDRKELVDIIVRQVIEALRGDATGPGRETTAETAPEAAPSADPAGPCVLVLFTGGTGSTDTVSAQLREIAAMPVRFDCILSRAASRVLGREVAQQLGAVDLIDETKGACSNPYDLVNRSSVVIAPFLTQNTAAKAALGIRDSLVSDALACAFLLRKPVVLVTDSLAVEFGPAAYRQTVLRHIRTLESYGARTVKAGRLAAGVARYLRPVAGAPAPRPSPPTAPGKALEARLVDLRCAMDWMGRHSESRSLGIGERAIVTPLALDYLKERGVLVERVVEKAASSSFRAGDVSDNRTGQGEHLGHS
ncbi:MAG: hypothetical protein HPY55_12000 [Firmicutes bacterium]|nr:hypothetical protein [Bacillota bacterium]